MKISYKKLWKLLIDKDMKKSDLRKAAGISSSSLAKLGKDENVTTDVLLRICNTLGCNLNDIVETVPDNDNPPQKLWTGHYGTKGTTCDENI